MSSSKPRRARAVELLDDILASGLRNEAALAEELVVPIKTLERFRTEEEPVPLDRQLCLALLAVQLGGPFARRGHQLKGQVSAAMAHEAREAPDVGVKPTVGRS